MSNTIQSVEWMPGTDLKSKINEDTDRLNVSIWQGDTTDICDLAIYINDIEKETDVEIWIVDSFELNYNYM